MRRPGLVRLPGPRLRARVLLAAKLLIVVAAILTLISVNLCTALTLSLFLIVGQAAIVVGVLLALFVATTDFFRTRGTSEVHFAAGEIIFRQGDLGDLVYVIVRGEVDAIREEAGQADRLLATMGPGEYFGEMALVSDAPRTATVRARSDLHAIVMARTDFAALYAYLPNMRQNVEEVMRRRKTKSRQTLGGKEALGWILALAASLALAPDITLAAGDATAGEKLYAKHACAQCHGPQGEGNGALLPMLKNAPSLRDWTDADAMADVTDEYMIEITEQGGKPLGKSEIMLKYGQKMTRDEIIDVVAYIRSLP